MNKANFLVFQQGNLFQYFIIFNKILLLLSPFAPLLPQLCLLFYLLCAFEVGYKL